MSPLTHRERIARVLGGDSPDRPATGEFFIADEFTRAFLRLAPTEAVGFAERRQVIERLDLDIASVSFSSGWGAPVQPDENLALEELFQWSSAGDRFVFALIDGPFSAAAKARGFNILMHYATSAPPAARELFREGAIEARMTAQAARDAGAEGIILGEDIAYGKSPYLSPRQLRELYFPELLGVARAIRALGLTVFFHSDGNLALLLEDLAACELNGLQGLEPEAGMSFDLVRSKVGPALTLWGNLGYEFLSVRRDDVEIAHALQGLTVTNGTASKLIIGSSPGLVQGLDPETVRAVYRTTALVNR